MPVEDFSDDGKNGDTGRIINNSRADPSLYYALSVISPLRLGRAGVSPEGRRPTHSFSVTACNVSAARRVTKHTHTHTLVHLCVSLIGCRLDGIFKIPSHTRANTHSTQTETQHSVTFWDKSAYQCLCLCDRYLNAQHFETLSAARDPLSFHDSSTCCFSFLFLSFLPVCLPT